MAENEEFPPSDTNPTPIEDPSHPSTGIESTTITSKRRPMETRSDAWEHFTTFNEGANRRAKCNYCGKTYASDPRRHGTSTLIKHLNNCKHHPCSTDLKQVQLSLHAIREGEGDTNDCITAGGVGGLTTWKFDQELCRKKLAAMIIKDELPFRHVEGEGFIDFVSALQPRFKIPSRWTVSRDCYQLFLDEKKNLRDYFKKSRQCVSITTDTWTSLQRLNYMCITAHYVDKNWSLHKRIINFCTIESHKGDELGRQIDGCLREWGIANVFTITVDNASSNDTCIAFLRSRLTARGCTFVEGKYLHMRCIAHVINLVVNAGLKLVNSSIEKVRDAVRFVRQSPARLARFKECCASENIECKNMLCLDVCTRWNSTYLMLNVAVKYEKAFELFEIEDPHFKRDLKEKVPTCLDWENAKRMVEVLAPFYHLTIRISGSLYVTSNTFYQEISTVNCLLNEFVKSVHADVRAMGVEMKEKYVKYWGDPEKMNKLIYVPGVLDPRYKMELFEYVFGEEYGKQGDSITRGLMSSLKELYNAYKMMNQPRDDSSKHMQEQDRPLNASESSSKGLIKIVSMSDKFKKRKMESGVTIKSELDIYLEEGDIILEMGNFNVLNWWKINEHRFPILSCLARAALSIPISTVVSESAFSTGSRVLDPFRSSLTPKIVESLLCVQDWTRRSRQLITIEEDLESIEKLEEDMGRIDTSEVNDNINVLEK